jgi:hypothetical protein
MTNFENMLIDKGYIKHILNCKTMKYEIANKHVISTMVNLDHRYIHKTDEVLLKKIEQGKSVMDDDFTLDDRKGVICFGLHEANKPPTLISPRPRIRVKRIREYDGEKQIVIENENFDDSMNLILQKEKPEQIFKALFDSSIFFNVDLIDQALKN